MPIVVSDASPLHYLIVVREEGVLPKLYGRVLVPRAVVSELQHPRAPTAVRTWLSNPPDWLEIVSTNARPSENSHLSVLGAGERAAIELALDERADLVLMDDREAVEEARRVGLTVVGTLGVLDLAAARGLTNLRTALERLQATNFRVSPQLIRHLLRDSNS
jgi:predicted nucleic acid-binding protein